MTMPRDWAAFVLAGLAASLLPTGGQLLFAAAAIAGLGLAHGASDLHVVDRLLRLPFLLTYVGAVAAVLICWQVSPGATLAGFLLLSALHFATDHHPTSDTAGGIRLGLLLVGGPALLHHAAVATLFRAAVDPTRAGDLATVLAAAGGVALIQSIAIGVRQLGTGDGRAAAATAAGSIMVLVPPPLVGFAFGFILLHARPQTIERMRELGYAHCSAYLRSVAPLLGGAAVVIAAAALTVIRGTAPATATLFAALAALAVPHMLVTPLFHGSIARRSRSAAAAPALPREASFPPR